MIYFTVQLRPGPGSQPLLTGLGDHTHVTHHTQQGSSGGVISPTLRRLLTGKTQHSQQTNSHSPRNPSKQAASDRRLRSRGHWNRHKNDHCLKKSFLKTANCATVQIMKFFERCQRCLAASVFYRQRAGLWYPSSRDFSGRKNPQHAFLRKGSKAVCPMSHICGI